MKLQEEILNNLKEVEKFGEVGIIFYNESFEVIWVNDFLDSRRINIVGKNIIKYNNAFCLITEDKHESIKLNIENRVYECKCLRELKMIIMKDTQMK